MEFLLVSLLVAMTVLLVWMMAVEPHRYQVTRQRVSVTKCRQHTLRILHLSDTHFARNDYWMSRFFDRLSQEPYDFVFLTGDIFDCRAGISFACKNLNKLKSRYGIYAVFGNHDYYNFFLQDVLFHNFPGQGMPFEAQPVELFTKALEETGIRVLSNESVECCHDGLPIVIYGLDDPTTERANLRQTLQGFRPVKLNILLSHTVDVLLDVGEAEIDLSFSGHSHGGQVCLPFLGPVVLHTGLGLPYVSGIKRYKGTVCSISRGLSASRFFPFRLLCRPEAVILELHS
ncbi:MAG: metallophosphoesterase [Candidatus Omnitrophica bacterium]|nr:metallophosphoesterase [Candidatus Omnitrophota bacterium]